MGIYEFTMGADGSKVKARYSFVYVNEDGEWKIAHHHSSLMPEAALEASSAVAEKSTVSHIVSRVVRDRVPYTGPPRVRWRNAKRCAPIGFRVKQQNDGFSGHKTLFASATTATRRAMNEEYLYARVVDTKPENSK